MTWPVPTLLVQFRLAQEAGQETFAQHRDTWITKRELQVPPPRKALAPSPHMHRRGTAARAAEAPQRHRRGTAEAPQRHHRDTAEAPQRHHRDTTEAPQRHPDCPAAPWQEIKDLNVNCIRLPFGYWVLDVPGLVRKPAGP